MQGTWGSWILTLHLNYVTGYTSLLLFLFERSHNYSVDDQGLVPWRLRRLGRSKLRSASLVRVLSDGKISRARGPKVYVILHLPQLKNGPELLEKESHEFLGSKRDDRFCNPFCEMVPKICQGRFSYLLWHDNFCKGPQKLRKIPQKCQKIAGCRESAFQCSRPLITSKPGLFPPQRTSPDNITSQPWSDATCPRTTASSTLSSFLTKRL